MELYSVGVMTPRLITTVTSKNLNQVVVVRGHPDMETGRYIKNISGFVYIWRDTPFNIFLNTLNKWTFEEINVSIVLYVSFHEFPKTVVFLFTLVVIVMFKGSFYWTTGIWSNIINSTPK